MTEKKSTYLSIRSLHAFFLVDGKDPKDIGYESQHEPLFISSRIHGIKKHGIPLKTDHYTLILITSGHCCIHAGYHNFQLLPQAIALLSDNKIFSIEKTSEDFTALVLSFKKEFLQESYMKENLIAELLLVNSDYPPTYELMNEAQYLRILREFQEIEREQTDQSPFFLNIIRLRIIELLYEYNRACEYCLNHFDKKMNRQFQISHQFRTLVNDLFLTTKTVNEYAALMHITPKYLSEMVKEELNHSALEIIHNRILLEAQYLLKHSTRTIKEISNDLNFDNMSHFGRLFKLKTGTTPSEYRDKT